MKPALSKVINLTGMPPLAPAAGLPQKIKLRNASAHEFLQPNPFLIKKFPEMLIFNILKMVQILSHFYS